MIKLIYGNETDTGLAEYRIFGKLRGRSAGYPTTEYSEYSVAGYPALYCVIKSPTENHDEYYNNISSPSLTPAKRMKEGETGSKFTCEDYDIFWDWFDEVVTDSNSDYRDQEKQKSTANEIDIYLKTSRIDHNHVPYIWWSVNSNQYVQLLRFARIYLSAPSSSITAKDYFGISSQRKRKIWYSFTTIF